MTTDTKFTCEHCGQHLEAPSDMATQMIPCPACGSSVVIPPLTTAPSLTANNKRPPLLQMWRKSAFISAVLTALWTLVIYTRSTASLEQAFGRGSPRLYALYYLVAIFVLSLLSISALMHFKDRSRLNGRISLPIICCAGIVFGLIIALDAPITAYSNTYTYLLINLVVLIGILAASAPLLLLAPLLSISRGWFRLIMTSGVVATLIGLSGPLTGEEGFILSRQRIWDLEMLLDPWGLFRGLTALLDLAGETFIRASMGFGIILAVSNVVLWIKRGFESKNGSSMI